MNHSFPRTIAYVGTYTKNGSEGIYAFDVNSKTGKLDALGVYANIENPSYLALDRNNRYLYSVMETDYFNGTNSGAVAAFDIDPLNGNLKSINFESTQGQVPCHICADSSNKFLFAANYRDGTVSVFPLNSDGSIEPVSVIIKHQGSGPNIDRQERAHAHFVSLSPEENYLFAVDLGIDKIMVYKFDAADGGLTLDEKRSVKIRPGSGPRHLAFHPNGKFIYLVNEISSDVVVFRYSSDFTFTEEQYISTLPNDYTGASTCAAIHVSPDGKFLYASNRGHDSITIYHIDVQTGKLEFVAHTPTEGKDPRDFAIDPTGRFLYAANQNSNNIVSFSIDGDTGVLQPLGQVMDVPSPVCIKFLFLKD